FTGLSSGNTYVSGTTLYYRPSAGGTFTVNANGASDPETGVAGYTFSPLNGFASATQSGNHVDVTFDGSSTGNGGSTVAAVNNTGVSSTPPTAFTVTKDAVAPAGGLLSINPYAGTLAVPVAKTDFADADSGIASNVVTRSDPQAPVGGVCPANGYTGPAGGSVAYANGPSSLGAISVDWDAGTDPQSGIAQVRVDRATASVSGGV